MVIDAAKGVEAQTIKLLEICRLRNTPIITFINKMDREVRDPLDVLGEIEDVLQLHCVPITWPIGMGKTFRGVFSLKNNELVRFRPGEERLSHDTETIKGLDNPELDQLFPMEMDSVREAIELVQGAGEPFSLEKFLAGEQSPVFFGSGINNFGVEDVLEALVDWAPRLSRVMPASASCSRPNRRSPVSSSRSRRTWIRTTATVSRSFACAPAAMSRA